MQYFHRKNPESYNSVDAKHVPEQDAGLGTIPGNS